MNFGTGIRVCVLAVTIFAGSTVCSLCAPPWMAKVGQRAPMVDGKDQDGKDWKMADFIGKKPVLLYFYPKDDTPHCTTEVCGFRDSLQDFKKDNVEVVGVSFDTEQSHQKFATKYKVNYPLLADPKGRIADAFGARITNLNMSTRVSFLIGLDGKIAYVNTSANAVQQIIEAKRAVARLKGN